MVSNLANYINSHVRIFNICEADAKLCLRIDVLWYKQIPEAGRFCFRFERLGEWILRPFTLAAGVIVEFAFSWQNLLKLKAVVCKRMAAAARPRMQTSKQHASFINASTRV